MGAWRELAPGVRGIPEPPAEAPEVRPREGDVLLVPGVAFDRAGVRLGRGGGFYDRAFPSGGSDAPLLLGVAFRFQIVESVLLTWSNRAEQICTTEIPKPFGRLANLDLVALVLSVVRVTFYCVDHVSYQRHALEMRQSTPKY